MDNQNTDNKIQQNDLAKIFGKFRRCTIDRKDQIFAELAALVKQ